MNEVSNKTIVALLAVALVVSVAGTLYSVSELNDISGQSYRIMAITGAVSGTGTSTINMDPVVDFVVSDATIDFGNGYTDGSDATVYTDGTAWSNWVNTSGMTGSDFTDDFTIINNGSAILNLTITNSDDAEDWLCGGSCPSSTSDVDYKIADESGESGSCDTGLGDDMPTTWTQAMTDTVVLAESPVCGYLNTDDSMNSLQVDFKIVVPTDVPTGDHLTTFTFTGYDYNNQ
jgi:hypothetical protein